MKDCPLCGGKGIIKANNWRGSIWIECLDCTFHTRPQYYEDYWMSYNLARDRAIKEWNSRPEEKGDLS